MEGAAGMRACCLWSAIGVARRSAMSRSTLYPACTCEGEREREREGGRGWERVGGVAVAPPLVAWAWWPGPSG